METIWPCCGCCDKVICAAEPVTKHEEPCDNCQLGEGPIIDLAAVDTEYTEQDFWEEFSK